MGENALLVSIIIRARDQASAVLRMLGINGQGALGMLQIGAVGVGAAMAGVAIGSTVMAAKFEQSMAKIEALTGTSSTQLVWYKQKIMDLAPAMGISADQLAQGLYFVISAGFSGEKAMDVLKNSAMAAKAGMTDMAGVADAVTSALNAYKESGYTAGQVTDMLTTAVTNGKMEWSDLTTSFGFTATTAHAAGLTLQETSAAVSTLTQVSGHHGARRIQMELDNLMRNVGVNTAAVAAHAHKLGVTFDEAAFKSMGFMDKLRYLKDLSHGDSAALEHLVGGAAAFIPASILLQQNGAAYNDILKQMGGNGEKTAHAFQVMQASVGAKWSQFLVTMQTLAITLGQHLLPAAGHLLDMFSGGFKGMAAWLGDPQHMQQLKAALIGIAIVLGVVLAPAVGSLVVASAPLLLTIGGIVLGGILLGNIIQTVVQHFGGWEAILKRLQPVLDVVRGLLDRAGTELRKAFNNPEVQHALQELQKALPQLLPVLKILGVLVGVTLFAGFQVLVTILRAVLGALPGVIQVFSGLIEVLGNIGRLVLDIVTGKWADIPNALKGIGGGLLHAAEGLGKIVTGALGGAIDHVAHMFGSSGDKLKAGLQNGVQHAAKGIGGFFSGLGTGVHGAVSGAGQGIGGFFSGLGTKAHDGLSRAKASVLTGVHAIGGGFDWLYQHNWRWKAMVDTIHHQMGRARELLSTTWQRITHLLHEAWQRIQTAAQTAWHLLRDRILTPVHDTFVRVQNVFRRLREWLLERWNEIAKNASDLWTRLVDSLKGLGARIGTAAHDHIVKPIQDKLDGLIQNAKDWGKNLVSTFIGGITGAAGKAGGAAQQILGHVTEWLGFHSPAPRVPESRYWGSNLVQMFAASITAAAPHAASAAHGVLRATQQALTAGGADANAAGSSASQGRFASSLGTLSGGTTVHQHNWAGAFPNATSAEEIRKAIREVQQEDYRKGRRAGGYQGLRAGV